MKKIRALFFFFFLFLGIMAWHVVGAASAAASTLLDNAGDTFAYPTLPDPTVWSVLKQGNVTQVPVNEMGLAFADPDNSVMLVYVHPPPFSSGD